MSSRRTVRRWSSRRRRGAACLAGRRAPVRRRPRLGWLPPRRPVRGGGAGPRAPGSVMGHRRPRRLRRLGLGRRRLGCSQGEQGGVPHDDVLSVGHGRRRAMRARLRRLSFEGRHNRWESLPPHLPASGLLDALASCRGPVTFACCEGAITRSGLVSLSLLQSKRAAPAANRRAAHKAGPTPHQPTAAPRQPRATARPPPRIVSQPRCRAASS